MKAQEEKSNDYILAKGIAADLKKFKDTMVITSDIRLFRRYLSLVAGKAKRQFVTKATEGGLLITRIK